MSEAVTAIGVDLGTSGVRVAAVLLAGDMVAIETAPLAAGQRRNPAVWWAALKDALAALAAAAGLSGGRAVAVDGTSGTVLAVSRDGTPLGDASMYKDRADAAAVARVTERAPPASGAHGATPPLALQGTGGIARMLYQADWITGRLCGRFDVSDENNALKTGYDPIERRWPDWLRELGPDIAQLPEVVEPGAPIGNLPDGLARALGLPNGVRVVAGTTDGCAAFLATGASAIGEAVTSLGSTLTLKPLSPTPIFASEYRVSSHRLGELWLVGGASNSGGAALAQHSAADRIAELSGRIDRALPEEAAVGATKLAQRSVA